MDGIECKYIYLILSKLIKPCTIHYGQNYTVLNVLWQSKGPIDMKYGHGKNEVM